MSNDHGLTPVAQGSFSKTPFAHILVYIHDRKTSGTLEVRDTHNMATIYFREGSPAKARTSFQGKGLGKILRDMGLIDDDQLRICQKEMVDHGGLQGEILMQHGFIDANGLVRGIREQLLLKIVDVFGMTDATYAFFEKANLLMGYGTDELFPLDLYPLMLAGLREHGDKLRLGQTLAALQDKWISAPDVETLRRFRPNAAERQVCADLLGGPVLYETLLRGGRHDPRVVQHTVYALLITREIIVSDRVTADSRPAAEQQRATLDSRPPAPAVAPVPENPETAAIRRRIQDKARDIAAQNYYEMLEIPIGATSAEAHESFIRLAREFHPDRASSPGLRDMRETLEYVFSNLSEAHGVLIDPEARAGYDAAIREGVKRTSIAPAPAAERQVRETLDAENAFQKALILMRRGQDDKAMELVQRARDLNPKEGEYMAVWAILESRHRPSSAPVDDLIGMLRAALEQSPNSERAHLFLAQLLKRVGHVGDARTHFEHVLRINPRNIEAARELRIMEMREREKAEKSKKGFFKKLLG